MHSWALSMVYLSVTFMVPMTAPVSPSTRAMSAPSLMDSSSVDRVMGIGQNRPLAVFMPSHTPCQSALVMNPVSGVKPPMPSMMTSPTSRDDSLILGSP